jgi:hypothetical protein
MGHREHPPTPGPQHPGDLSHHLGRVRDERHRTEGGTREVEAPCGEGQSTSVSLHQGHRDSGFVGCLHPVQQHRRRQIQADDLCAVGSQPTRARR